MTIPRARALIEAAKKATDAPWGYGRDPSHFDAPEITKKDGAFYVGTKMEDAAFIALSRNDAPAIAEALVEACELFQSISEQYENQDLSHEQFRVKCAQFARAFLAKMENGNG